MNEFEAIKHFFSNLTNDDQSVCLGIGDDCAIIDVPKDFSLLACVDTMNEGVHFFPNTYPDDLAYKALAVNLSDIAAMGGIPKWVTLSLSLPDCEEKWLTAFVRGLKHLCELFDLSLVSGDLTRGPLSVCVQCLGLVEKGGAITRSGAKPGDKIYVSGQLGDAALALTLKQPNERLLRPTPRITLARRLRTQCHAAIDISDGLVGDLNHILECSRVGALIDYEKCPRSERLKNASDQKLVQQCILSGGDDYELILVAPVLSDPDLTCIGVITDEIGLKIRFGDRITQNTLLGYLHFQNKNET